MKALGLAQQAGCIIQFKALWQKNFLPFEEARVFVRGLYLKTQKKWYAYRISEKRPNNIPSNPYDVYKNSGWCSWADWLGTGTIANQNKKYLSFDQARTFVRKLTLVSREEWVAYARSEKKPKNIPTNLRQTYRDCGWHGWGDFLGTGFIHKKNFLLFKKARAYVRKLRLKSQGEWRAYIKSGKKLDNIPSDPSKIYKDKGWCGFGDWLGTGYVANQNRKFLPFDKAWKIVKKLHLKSLTEWHTYCKSGKRPDSIPAECPRVYKDKWQGWGHFLGTGTVAPQYKKFLPFEEARVFVRKLKLKNTTEWDDYRKTVKFPKNIPQCPGSTYKNMFKGIKDWLGVKIQEY